VVWLFFKFLLTWPEFRVSNRRLEELIVRCVCYLWYCSDTVQSGRIFGMHVVAVGSSDSLVFTDGQLEPRSWSGYGFEIPRPVMAVGRQFIASPRVHLVSCSVDDVSFPESEAQGA
jgi:hypothetical protein